MPSDLERRFENLAGIFELPEYETEYRFHPVRRWRFDVAFPEQKVAIELEGGTWMRGRHVRGKGFEEDCAKYNSALILGWRVLRFTTGMLETDPVTCLDQVRALLSVEVDDE